MAGVRSPAHVCHSPSSVSRSGQAGHFFWALFERHFERHFELVVRLVFRWRLGHVIGRDGGPIGLFLGIEPFEGGADPVGHDRGLAGRADRLAASADVVGDGHVLAARRPDPDRLRRVDRGAAGALRGERSHRLERRVTGRRGEHAAADGARAAREEPIVEAVEAVFLHQNRDQHAPLRAQHARQAVCATSGSCVLTPAWVLSLSSFPGFLFCNVRRDRCDVAHSHGDTHG